MFDYVDEDMEDGSFPGATARLTRLTCSVDLWGCFAPFALKHLMNLKSRSHRTDEILYRQEMKGAWKVFEDHWKH